ncbi:superoxide dismutase [Pseudonocardia dioxanivorans]|uniref:superoxide dismutase n=1 Tax=Pseudonocardia dioxanivorans TaxID=240495 RepID=UPI000CCFEDFD|nr:superoxide dismutase [Pseudonocardia dioxanivorans]
MTNYTLPDLSYDYNALAPHIAPEIMELHHSKHHNTYVTALNQTIEKLAAARDAGDFGAIVGLEKTLAFNLGGHVNHSIFWNNLSPEGGDKPTGELAAAIDDAFGSFNAFQAHFAAAATTIQGSGWAILGWDALGGQLLVHQLYDQQGNLPVGQIPLVMLDMWEHAFYLQYKNVKPAYVEAWWNVVNWADADKRFAVARSTAGGLITV